LVLRDKWVLTLVPVPDLSNRGSGQKDHTTDANRYNHQSHEKQELR